MPLCVALKALIPRGFVTIGSSSMAADSATDIIEGFMSKRLVPGFSPAADAPSFSGKA